MTEQKLVSEIIGAYKKAYEQEEKKHKRIPVTFEVEAIKNIFDRKSDGKKIAIIAFPERSVYEGYVFFYPSEWIHKDKTKADKRYIYIPDNYKSTIIKTGQDTKGKFVTLDQKVILAPELKEAMKKNR